MAVFFTLTESALHTGEEDHDDDDDEEEEEEENEDEDEEAAQELKRKLLEHLQKRTYVKLTSSPVAGVGVVAIRDIPPGTDPFMPANAHLVRSEERWVRVRASELAQLPPAVRAHVLDFFAAADDPDDPSQRLLEGDEYVYNINATGLEGLDASWFINHGAAPNVETVYRKHGYSGYVTTRFIRAGEELLACYATHFPDLYTAITQPPRAGRSSQRAAMCSELRRLETAAEQLRCEIRNMPETPGGEEA